MDVDRLKGGEGREGELSCMVQALLSRRTERSIAAAARRHSSISQVTSSPTELGTKISASALKGGRFATQSLQRRVVAFDARCVLLKLGLVSLHCEHQIGLRMTVPRFGGVRDTPETLTVVQKPSQSRNPHCVLANAQVTRVRNICVRECVTTLHK